MNTTIKSMKDEEEDKHRKMSEKITIMEKRLARLEDLDNRQSIMKTNAVEFHKTLEDKNRRRAVAAGFHDDTTEQEVEDLLKETIVATGMLMEKIQIKRPAKPITHAFQ